MSRRKHFVFRHTINTKQTRISIEFGRTEISLYAKHDVFSAKYIFRYRISLRLLLFVRSGPCSPYKFITGRVERLLVTCSEKPLSGDERNTGNGIVGTKTGLVITG